MTIFQPNFIKIEVNIISIVIMESEEQLYLRFDVSGSVYSLSIDHERCKYFIIKLSIRL
jgi:hypothetical protein